MSELAFKIVTSLRALAGVLFVLGAYYSTLILRCALVSLAVLGIVLAFRRLIPDRYTELRACLWSAFIAVPFIGKMRLWYENAYILRAFFFIQELPSKFFILRLVIPLTALLLCVLVLIKELRLEKSVRLLPFKKIAGLDVSVTPSPVSAFSCGLFRPRIVVPEAYLKTMSEEELSRIILHERTHIRLGHLWIFFLWDILCSALFPNPFLRLAARYLREDMEACCDRMTIQLSGQNALSYGRLILKAMSLQGAETIPSPATLYGEKTYAEAKRRIRRICDFSPFDIKKAAAVYLICAVIIAGALSCVRLSSYDRYNKNELVTIFSVDNDKLRLKTFVDTDKINRAVTWDREAITIDKREFESLRAAEPGEDDVDRKHFYICFDTFYKVPGIGGGGQIAEIDLSDGGDILRVPYEWSTDIWTEFFRII